MKMPNDVSGNYSELARGHIVASAKNMRDSLDDFLNGKSRGGKEDVELFNIVKGYAIEGLSRDLKIMVLTGSTYDAKECLNQIAGLVEAEY